MPLNNAHWIMPHYRQRMMLKEWREILLRGEDRIVYRGEWTQLKAKKLDAGVVEVYKQLAALRENQKTEDD